MNKKQLYNVYRVFFDRNDNIIRSIPLFNPCSVQEAEILLTKVTHEAKYKNGVTYTHIVEKEGYEATPHNHGVATKGKLHVIIAGTGVGKTLTKQ